MKKFLQSLPDRLFPWRKRIHALRIQVQSLTIQNGVLMGLLESERRQLEKLVKEHEQNKKGVGVLLKFIHASHHLAVPFSDGTIRNEIQKGMNETSR